MNTVLATVLLFITYVLCQREVSNIPLFQLDSNDNEVLALALFVENFDTNYYAQYLDPSVNANAFTSNDFQLAGYTAADYELFLILLANERAHVTFLNSVLQQRNGSTVPPCVYNYPLTTSVRDFVFYSKLFENVGTAAYDGSINSIYDKTLQQGAATIATVEARHAAFLNSLATYVPANAPALNGLNLTYPFPFVTDVAFPATTVVAMIRPFINHCPYSLNFNPLIAVVIPVAAPQGALANPSQAQVTQNDINTANFALTLELLEATFYNNLYPTLSVGAFQAVGYTASQYAYFDVVRAHENMHVTILRNAILNAGGTPVVNCTYNFGVNAGDATAFVTTAALLENTGVQAYDGAINAINDPGMRQAAATIATVEARHAAIISQIINFTNPYSADRDTATAPADIVAALFANGLVDNTCAAVTNPANLPQVVRIIPYSNATTPAPTTSTPSVAPVSTTTTSSASIIALAVVNVAILAIALF